MSEVSVHLIMAMRTHRRPLHPNGLNHEYMIEGADTKAAVRAAVALVQEKMRDDYADPVEIQHVDRTPYLDSKQIMRMVNGETFESVTGANNASHNS